MILIELFGDRYNNLSLWGSELASYELPKALGPAAYCDRIVVVRVASEGGKIKKTNKGSDFYYATNVYRLAKITLSQKDSGKYLSDLLERLTPILGENIVVVESNG